MPFAARNSPGFCLYTSAMLIKKTKKPPLLLDP